MPKELDLSFSNIATWPNWIESGEYSELEVLNIYATKITELPDAIGNLIGLEEFECDSELREELPEPLKSRFYYKSYFDFFYKNCKERELFACQIYLRDGSLLLIDKDLAKLSEVDERDILYFQGKFQSYVGKWDSEDNSPMFVDVDSKYQKYFVKDYFTIIESGCSRYGADTSPMDTYELFGISVLYHLIEEGISYEIVKELIPQLFQHYDTVLKPWVGSHKEFLEDWECRINRFISRQHP